MKQKPFFRKIPTISLFLIIILVSIYLYFLNKDSRRGSIVTYRTQDRFSGKEMTSEARIIALPGESIRINLQNDQVYLKIKNKSYKLKENYIPESMATMALMFNDSWYKLGDDEIFVINDNRNITTMADFIYKDNVIKQSQILTTIKPGNRSYFKFVPINEVEEFGVKVNEPWSGWQIQTDSMINIKNGAVPDYFNNLVFVPTVDNKFTVLDLMTGQKKWSVDLGSRPLRFTPDEKSNLISINTENKKTYVFNLITGQKIEEKDTPTDVQNRLDVQPLVLDTDSNYKIEELANQIKLYKTDQKGNIIWQHLSSDKKYFPNKFKIYGSYLVGLGDYGGNSYEDVSYKASIYIINANTGRLISVKDDIGYNNYNVFDNVLVIYDRGLKGYDLASGKLLWTYKIGLDLDPSHQNLLIDQTNQSIISSDDHEIVSLKKDGTVIWSTKIESKTGVLYTKNNLLHFLDQGKSKFYTLDIKTGETKWSIDTTDPSGAPYLTDQGNAYFKNLRQVKFQFTNTEFSVFDPVKKSTTEIFNYITPADNDIYFKYSDPYILLFTNDFVTAIKYNPQ